MGSGSGKGMGGTPVQQMPTGMPSNMPAGMPQRPLGIGKGSKGGGGMPVMQRPGGPPPQMPMQRTMPAQVSSNAPRATMPLRTQMYQQQQGLQAEAAQRGIASLARENARPQVSWNMTPVAAGSGTMFPGINPGAITASPTYKAPAPVRVAAAAAPAAAAKPAAAAAPAKSISDLKQSASAGVMPPPAMQKNDPVNYHILKTKALRARGGLGANR